MGPDGNAAPMGDNPGNPQAASASQVGGPAGVRAEPDPAAPNPGNETNEGLLGDKAHAEAEAHLLRQRVALAEDDLRKAREDGEAQRARIASWQDAFGLHDGDDPKERVRATIAALDAGRKRVATLQAALGIGDDDDPKRAVGALREPAQSKVGTLPPHGQLLLLTQLAKLTPNLGQSYASTPDTIQEPNGDRWTALRQEALQEDGTVGHVVTIQREPATFRYDQARASKLQYESERASAMRSRDAAGKAAELPHLSPMARRDAQGRLETFERRLAEIDAALRDLEPSLVRSEVAEWRFTVGLDGYEPVGS